MINTILFGINIILSILIWKLILKPSILDYFRDKLFDLREETRAYYIVNDIPLSDSSYKNLRELLNNYLRFTENMSLVGIIFLAKKIHKNREIYEYITKEVDSKFKFQDEQLDIIAKKVREKSSSIVLNYMVFSSPILISLFISIIPVSIFLMLAKKTLNELTCKVEVISVALIEISKIVTSYIITKDNLEKISFEFS